MTSENQEGKNRDVPNKPITAHTELYQTTTGMQKRDGSISVEYRTVEDKARIKAGVTARQFAYLSEKQVSLHQSFQSDFQNACASQDGNSYLWADGIRWKAWQLGYERGIAEQAEKIESLEKINRALQQELRSFRSARKKVE